MQPTGKEGSGWRETVGERQRERDEGRGTKRLKERERRRGMG